MKYLLIYVLFLLLITSYAEDPVHTVSFDHGLNSYRPSAMYSIVHGVAVLSNSESSVLPEYLELFKKVIEDSRPILLFVARPKSFDDNVKYAFVSCLRLQNPKFQCMLTSESMVANDPIFESLRSVDYVVPVSFFADARIISRVVCNVVDSYNLLFDMLPEEDSIIEAYKFGLYRKPTISVYRHSFSFPLVGLATMRRLTRSSDIEDMTGRYSDLYGVVTNSKAATEQLQNIFHSYAFLEFGSMKNDVFKMDELDVITSMNVDLDSLSVLNSAKSNGKIIVGYTPYNRIDDNGDETSAFSVDALSINHLSQFAVANNILFVLSVTTGVDIISLPPGVLVIKSNTDIYPLLRFIDILVSDYASVIFDFLLYNRPIICFTYFHDDFISSNGLFVDYEKIAPGPVVSSEDKLFSILKNVALVDSEEWRGHRKKLSDSIHTYHDGQSGGRLMNYIESEFLKGKVLPKPPFGKVSLL